MNKGTKDAPNAATDRALGKNEKNVGMELGEEIKRISLDLGIPTDEAERMVCSSRGIKRPIRTKFVPALNQLIPGMTNISLRARMVTVHSRERSNGDGRYSFGLLGDAVTTVAFSAWGNFDLEVGRPFLLENVSVREWRGRLEVVVNRNSMVLPLSDDEGLVPEEPEGIPASISELNKGSRTVDLLARVIELTPAKVKVRGEEKEVIKGVLADSSGMIDFTCWGPMEILMGVCYRIRGGYVKDFKGTLKLNFDAGAIIRSVPDGSLPPAEDLKRPRKGRLGEIMEKGSGGPVLLRGTFVDIRPGSGIFKKCRECGRRMVKGLCTVHGKVEGDLDLGLRAVFDDGTCTAMVRCDRFVVESLLGQKMDELSEELIRSLDPDLVEERLSSALLGHPWTLSGLAMIDDYGCTIVAERLSKEWDREEIMTELLEMIEVVA